MLDLVSTIGVFAQEGLSGLTAITELVLTVSKPRAHLFADTALDGHVQNRALLRDARAVHDVELSRAERSGDLVLNNLGTHTIADDLVLELNAVNAANIDTHRREELEGAAARRSLGVAEHDADLLAQLVNEDAGRFRFGERTGELTECLAHQTGLKADRSIADLALNLSTRSQSGDRVDDDGVDGARAHKHVDDLERLLARIGLGNEDLIDVHADTRGIRGIERVLGINKCHDAAHSLGLSQNLERKRCLTGGLGTVNLDDTAARHAADAQRGIEGQGASGNGLDLELGTTVAVPHD